jgi:hypothetical protein
LAVDCPSLIHLALAGSMQHCVCARRVCGVVQKGLNVVHKQGIENGSNLLLVGEF